MLDPFFLSLCIYAVSLISFLVIPLIGMRRTRREWQRFRDNIFKSLDAQLYNLQDMDFHPANHSLVRFYGVLDSVEGDEYIWVKNAGSSLKVLVKHQTVHLLAGEKSEDFKETLDQPLQQSLWEHTGILAEGAGVFILGNLNTQGPMPVVTHEPGQPFLLILFNGAPEYILGRAIWRGHPRNEFWNNLTPPSLVLGTGLLFILAIISFRHQGFASGGVWAICFALVPYLALMPPGVLLYFLYRRLWRQACLLKAKKDLFLLASRMKSSPVLRRNCQYDEVQVLPGTSTAEALAKKLEIPVVSLSPEKNAPGLKAWFHPRILGDPSGEAYLFEGMSPQCTHRLNRMIRLRSRGALASFLLGLVGNFLLVLFLMVQLVMAL